VYARVSSTEQERDGFSIPAQLRALHEYAKKQHFKIVREFIEAETAKRAGRPEFKEMLAFLEASDSVKTVLVEKTDRLYRNFRDYVTVDELDLEIHLVKENEILGQDSKSHQKFIHGIKVLMAKNFIDNLSEETKKGMAEKVRAGGFPHRAPVGYLNDRLTRTIVVDPVRGPYIRRLFELYAAGRDSLPALQHRADQDGMLPSGSASRSTCRRGDSESARQRSRPKVGVSLVWAGEAPGRARPGCATSRATPLVAVPGSGRGDRWWRGRSEHRLPPRRAWRA